MKHIFRLTTNVRYYDRLDGKRIYLFRVMKDGTAYKRNIVRDPFETPVEEMKWASNIRGIMKRDPLQRIPESITTVSELFDVEYVPNAVNIKQNTLYGYITIFNKHIRPFMGNVLLEDVTLDLLRRHQAAMAAAGVGDHTRKQVHRLESSLFNIGFECGYMKSNPASSRHIAPRCRPGKQDVLNAEELVSFFECAEKHDTPDWYLIYTLTLFTACRRGELMALEWDRLDFRHNLVTFDQSVESVRGVGLQIGDVKTTASRRTLPVPQTVMKALGERLMHSKGRFVFHSRENPNAPMSPESYGRHLARFSQEHWRRKITPHVLRRTAATLLERSGVSLATAKAYLGHTDIRTTLTYYIYRNEQDLKDAQEALCEYLDAFEKDDEEED